MVKGVKQERLVPEYVRAVRLCYEGITNNNEISSMAIQDAFQKALELDEEERIEDAVTCLDDVFNQIPNEAGYLKFAGMLYQRLGEDDKSFGLLNRALDLTPKDAELHLGLGFHYTDNGQQDKAAASFEKHVRLDPQSQIGFMFLGRAYDYLHDFEQAEANLRRSVELDLDAYEPHVQLARILGRRGTYEEALREYEKADQCESGDIITEIGLWRINALKDGQVPATTDLHPEPATVVCVKQGDKYGPEYANRLASMVRRWSSESPRIVCFTENPTGLSDNVEHQPLLTDNLKGWWNKVALFKVALPGVTGRILYFDLDVVITGDIDPLLHHGGDFVIMDNDYVPGFNTSVFLLESGTRPEIWENYTPEIGAEIAGDQDWVALNAPDAELWPDGWCVPYRLRAAHELPDTAKVVVFSGHPNPEDYPSPWIKEHWR